MNLTVLELSNRIVNDIWLKIVSLVENLIKTMLWLYNLKESIVDQNLCKIYQLTTYWSMQSISIVEKLVSINCYLFIQAVTSMSRTIRLKPYLFQFVRQTIDITNSVKPSLWDIKVASLTPCKALDCRLVNGQESFTFTNTARVVNFRLAHRLLEFLREDRCLGTANRLRSLCWSFDRMFRDVR